MDRSPGPASRRTGSPSPHGVIVVLLILVAALSRPIQALFGLDPDAFHQNLIDANTSLPTGGWGGMSWDHPLGVDPQFGRDVATRILEGSWVSLVVAFGATILSNVIGTILGVVAGYYGGRVDSIISRLRWTPSSPSRCCCSPSPSRRPCRAAPSASTVCRCTCAC